MIDNTEDTFFGEMLPRGDRGENEKRHPAVAGGREGQVLPVPEDPAAVLDLVEDMWASSEKIANRRYDNLSVAETRNDPSRRALIVELRRALGAGALAGGFLWEPLGARPRDAVIGGLVAAVILRRNVRVRHARALTPKTP